MPQVLQLLRTRLGMDVAFVSQITDGRRIIKAVDSVNIELSRAIGL